jgi:hypothetical protein
MNHILRIGTKLFMNPNLFNQGLPIENDMIIIINFHLYIVDLHPRTYSVTLFCHYQDKVNNFILVFYFLPFSTLTENTISLECTKTLQYNFALLVRGRCIYISHKDTLQRIIHVNFKLSYITQNFYESYYNSYSIMASYLLKLSVCYFNAPLFKDNSTA